MGNRDGAYPFGFRAWLDIRARIGRKYINKRGRNVLQRYAKFSSFKVGDLISTCDGFNSRVVEVDPYYVPIPNSQEGVYLFDLDIATDTGSCSFYHCGVGLPKTYGECVKYRDSLLKHYQHNDPWGFCERYSYENMTIHSDGTYTRKDFVPK